MKNERAMMADPALLAVADISSARTPGQFRLIVEPDRQWVRHEVVAWSVGLRWLTFVFHNTVHDLLSPPFLQGRDAEYLETVEQPAMQEWMQHHLRRHDEMHEAAFVHGLTPGGANELPVEHFLIDRLLKEMVEREDIDVHGSAEEIASDDDYIQFLANEQKYMGKYLGGERHVLVRQSGDGLPVVSATVPLGRAIYCGHALDLDHPLPEIIRDGVVGRRLGNLVDTGNPRLDARIITKVATSQDHFEGYMPSSTETRLYFEPDLVELGSRRALVSGRRDLYFQD